MYRARFSGDLNEEVLSYLSSMSEDEEIALYDILGSQAHTIMLYECGIITKDDAKKILRALKEIKAESVKSNGAEDIHEQIESAVIAKAGMESGGKMHTARSRNDQVALDIRMKLRNDINVLRARVVELVSILLDMSRKYSRTAMPLYTHMQQAQVGTVSHYMLAQVDLLFRDIDRLESAYDRINDSPLGAGPVGGTSMDIDRDRVASLLGFDGIVENSIDATSSRDVLIEYASVLAILMNNLSRMAEDVIIWSSSEFAFVSLADNISSPSSIMPQKKNPDIMEITRAKSAEVAGDLVAMLMSTKGVATGYGRDLQQTKKIILRASRTTAQAVAAVRVTFEKMSINKNAMKRAMSNEHILALDVAERLAQNGVPFRKAHGVAGQIIQQAAAAKRKPSSLAAHEISDVASEIKVSPSIVLEAVKSATVSSSLKNRISKGSAGLAEQERMRYERINKWDRYMKEADQDSTKIVMSFGDMLAIVNEITGE